MCAICACVCTCSCASAYLCISALRMSKCVRSACPWPPRHALCRQPQAKRWWASLAPMQHLCIALCSKERAHECAQHARHVPMPPLRCVRAVFTEADKADPNWQADVVDDVTGEASKFGQVVHCFPDPNSVNVSAAAQALRTPLELPVHVRAGAQDVCHRRASQAGRPAVRSLWGVDQYVTRMHTHSAHEELPWVCCVHAPMPMCPSFCALCRPRFAPERASGAGHTLVVCPCALPACLSVLPTHAQHPPHSLSLLPPRALVTCRATCTSSLPRSRQQRRPAARSMAATTQV